MQCPNTCNDNGEMMKRSGIVFFYGTHKQQRQYKIDQLLGEGGNGKVYLAKDLQSGRAVALKMTKSARGYNGLTRSQRFQKEIDICTRLKHPNIIRLIESGTSANGDYFAAFDHIEGETLASLLSRRGALPPQLTQTLMGQLLDALEHLSKFGITHRDLKPSNIIISEKDNQLLVKIIDFGLAEYTSTDTERCTHYKSYDTLGTPRYAAPEQLRGELSSPRSDLYSWGLITLECLTGHPAVQGINLAEICFQQLQETDIPIDRSLLCHPIAEILKQVLHKNPKIRPKSIKNLSEQFKSLDLTKMNITQQKKVHTTQNITTYTDFSSSENIHTCSARNIVILAGNFVIHNQNSHRSDDAFFKCLKLLNHNDGELMTTFGHRFLIVYHCNDGIHIAAKNALSSAKLIFDNIATRIDTTIHIGINTGFTRKKNTELCQDAISDYAIDLMSHAEANSCLLSDSIYHHIDSSYLSSISEQCLSDNYTQSKKRVYAVPFRSPPLDKIAETNRPLHA